MKKSRYVKNLAFACFASLSIAGVSLGTVSFLEYAKTDFTGIRATVTEQPTQPAEEYNELSFSIGSYSRNYWAIDGYNGTEKNLTLPSTFSFGPKVDKTYNFNDSMDIQNWQEKYEALLAYENDPNNPEWAMEHYEDEIFSLIFTDSNGDKYEAKSFMQIHEKLMEAVFPVSVTYKEPTIIEGTDCKISIVQKLNDTVETVYVPKDLWYDYGDGTVWTDCISFVNLGKNIKNVVFDEENPLYAKRVFQNGFLVNKETLTLIGIANSAYADNLTTLSIPSKVGDINIEEINFQLSYNVVEKFENVNKIIFEDGIKKVGNCDFIRYIGQSNITVDLPTTMTHCALTTYAVRNYVDLREDGQFTWGDYKYNNSARTDIKLIFRSVPIGYFTDYYSIGSDLTAGDIDYIQLFVADDIYDEFLSNVRFSNNLNNKVNQLSTYSA